MHGHTLALVFFLLATVLVREARAQTTIDPEIVEFGPSSEHWVMSPSGVPLVAHYVLSIFEAESSTASQFIDIGKPAPDPDGKIRVSLAAILPSAPLPLITYKARVTAVGVSGNADSDWSNSFVFNGPCVASATISTPTFGPEGGSGTFAVTTAPECPWSASSNVSWITGAAEGTGSQTVGYSVAANTSTDSRTGQLTIATAIVTVTQAGAQASTCEYGLDDSSGSFRAQSAHDSVTLTTQQDCTWTASSSVPWITVTPAAGTGSGRIDFFIAQNRDRVRRTGILTVGGQRYTVTQYR